MFDAQMMARVQTGEGFIAALDQSGGSTPKALKIYGIDENAYRNDAVMFALIHEMRCRIMTSPSFGDGRIIGAILFEKTMDGIAGGKQVPTLLRDLNIATFLKVDKGLQDEIDGVQMMRPIPDLDALLERAKTKQIFGTKMRSVIHRASRTGIAAIAEQQFDLAKDILAHGLLPIVEPEVNINSAERGQCDTVLLEEIQRQLEILPQGSNVMLKLSLPAQPDHYAPLLDHPRVARIAALSGGYSREEACTQLARNRGMIASFSRALLQDLRHMMSDEEFDRTLDQAIEQIYRASTQKTG